MLPRLDWRAAARALAGFAVALAAWAFLSPLYDQVVAFGASHLLRTFERPAVTTLRPMDDGTVMVDRSDFDPRSKRPGIPVSDLTFNVLLLAALFASAERPFSDRNVGRFIAASLLLAVTHVFALAAEVMSLYALKLGSWSRVHYGELERNLWGVIPHAYRLVLMYAIAFALWWVLRPTEEVTVRKARRRK